MTDIRDDAFELYMAEASRLRIRDRSGTARIRLRCGVSVLGTMGASISIGEVDGCLSLDATGRVLLVAVGSIVAIHGGTTRLRDESAVRGSRTVTSLLREYWSTGARVRALLGDGRWIDGVIVLVASDHVELLVAEDIWTIPLAGIEAWDLGRSDY